MYKISRHVYVLTLMNLILLNGCKNFVEEVPVEDKVFLLSKRWSIINNVFVSGQRDNVNDYSEYVFTFDNEGGYSFSRLAALGLNLAEEGSWEIRENNLILNSGEDEISVFFNNLTESTLELTFVVKDTFKGDISIKFDLSN